VLVNELLIFVKRTLLCAELVLGYMFAQPCRVARRVSVHVFGPVSSPLGEELNAEGLGGKEKGE